MIDMNLRTGVFSVGSLLCGIAMCAPLSAATPAKGQQTAGVLNQAPLPPAVASAVNSGRYDAAYTALLQYLTGKKLSPENTGVLRAAMLLEIIRVTGSDIMTAYAKDADKRAFLAEFAQDADWQELYLGCGLVPYRTDIGINVLYRIWKAEKGKVADKRLAVALASVWGGGETAPNPNILTRNPSRFNPVWRYQFFCKQQAAGLLHPDYPKLKPWELRFVVGIPGQDWDDGSYAYAAENINMPWDQYTAACWAAAYTGQSKFGDTVQGGMYNLPFSDESTAETTHRNGGVCGAMSHLGAVAAMSHGIPAFTVGQPGHCAYGVRVERGKWVGGFGGPDGGAQNYIFTAKAPTGYLLMETVFGDDAGVAKAYRQSICARAAEATGDRKGALALWQQALKTSPLHPFFRKELHRLMKETGTSADAWFSYLQQTIPLYRGNGFSSVDMAADISDIIAGMSDDRKVDIYGRMHTAIASTQSSWATSCGDILTAQYATLGGEPAQEAFLSMLFNTHMNAGDGTVFGQALEWAVKTFVQGGKAETFSRAFAAAAQSAPTTADENGKERAAKMKEAYAKAIIAAEQARSAPAFRMLVTAALQASGPVTPAGKLSGQNAPAGAPAEAALFRSSSTGSWDSPTAHAALMTTAGGHCHSAKEERPFFIVELKDGAELTGCIIRKTDGNAQRMKKATVYTSADGATWMAKASTDDMPHEWSISFPAGTKGKWVKVEFDNSAAPDFAHLSHFIVYTR